MQQDKLISIGYVVKSFGVKGAVTIFSDTLDWDELVRHRALFVEIDSDIVPFMIEEIKEHSTHHYILLFEGVDSPEMAVEMLIGNRLFLPKEEISSFISNLFTEQVIGYEVVDAEFGIVGEIREIIANPAHHILSIFRGKKELLLPVTEHTILAVDDDKRLITVNLPDGLAEVYDFSKE